MDTLAKQLALQFREIQLEGRWVAATNLKETLDDVTWTQAHKRIGEHNTIALLTYHIHYYIKGINQYFEGKPLTIRDKHSFDLPDIQSEEEWKHLKQDSYAEAERFVVFVEKFSLEELASPFVKTEYGNLFRNISAMISHSYYHLGQIVLLKKLI